jgi:hypothetical protein
MLTVAPTWNFVDGPEDRSGAEVESGELGAVLALSTLVGSLGTVADGDMWSLSSGAGRRASSPFCCLFFFRGICAKKFRGATLNLYTQARLCLFADLKGSVVACGAIRPPAAKKLAGKMLEKRMQKSRRYTLEERIHESRVE